MRAAATIVTGLALMVRISSALPASKSSLQLREYEDECTTNDDCGEKYECVKVGGKSRFVGLWGDYGSMPEHMACRESDECQTDDDCEGEFNICMDIAPKQCKPNGATPMATALAISCVRCWCPRPSRDNVCPSIMRFQRSKCPLPTTEPKCANPRTSASLARSALVTIALAQRESAAMGFRPLSYSKSDISHPMAEAAKQMRECRDLTCHDVDLTPKNLIRPG